MTKQKTMRPFPYNLVRDVFGREVPPEELPPDIDESVEYVLDNMMPERDAFIHLTTSVRCSWFAQHITGRGSSADRGPKPG